MNEQEIRAHIELFENENGPIRLVYAVIVSTEKRLVLVQTAKNFTEKFYKCPGGKVEEKEDPLAALPRELLEEISLREFEISNVFLTKNESEINAAFFLIENIIFKNLEIGFFGEIAKIREFNIISFEAYWDMININHIPALKHFEIEKMLYANVGVSLT